MIEIYSEKGEMFSYNERTDRIFKNGEVIPSTKCEPIFSAVRTKEQPPRFSGILFKESNTILSLSGKYNPVTDVDAIS